MPSKFVDFRPAPLGMALLSLALLSRPATAVENWTSFRGPTDQGHVFDSQVPTAWSEGENVAWKTPIDGKAWSSPVIWGDRIFVTNATEDGSRLSIVAVDKNTGEVLYDTLLRTVALPQYCHPFNSYASPSPVVEEGRLYVSFGSPYNGCLDMESGDVIWERTDFVCNHFRGAGSSPYLYNGRIYLHFDGADEQYVVALDKQTGETIWRTDRSVDFNDIDPATGKPDRDGDWRKAYSTPLVIDVDGRPILLSLGSKALYGYDPENGEEIWRIEFPDSHSGALRPVVYDGLVIFSTGSGGQLWAVRPDGHGVVTDTHVAWTYDRAVPKRASPVIVDGLVYVIDDSGIAACLDARTGEQKWLKRLGGNFSASPIYADGRIYFFDQDGKATVIRASGDYEVLAENHFDDGFMASPAVSGNALFLRTRSHLYRVEEQGTGK